MNQKTDEEIAHLVKQGNADIFGELVERYEAKIVRYARKFLFGREDAEDLTQEVFIKAYTNIQSFDTARKFSSWLYRIAHNEFINKIKKNERQPLLFFDPDTLWPHPAAKETADKEANINDIRNMLDQGLGKLDAKYREVLVLYYYEELDYKEISEILRIPTSTVGVRLRRGRDKLKLHYQNEESAL